MATTEQLAQALSEVRQRFAEVRRLTMEAQRARSQPTAASSGQVDPRISGAEQLQQVKRTIREIGNVFFSTCLKPGMGKTQELLWCDHSTWAFLRSGHEG